MAEEWMEQKRLLREGSGEHESLLQEHKELCPIPRQPAVQEKGRFPSVNKPRWNAREISPLFWLSGAPWPFSRSPECCPWRRVKSQKIDLGCEEK